MKVQLLLSTLLFFSIGLFAQTDNFFYDTWQPKDISIEGYNVIEMPTDPHHAEVLIDLNDVGEKVSPNVFGTNSGVWATRFYDQPKLVNHLRDLQPHVIRFPGGSLSDVYFWDLSYGNRPADIPEDMGIWAGKDTESWSMSVDDYYKLLDSTGADGSICVNYGYARYGLSEKPVEQAAHLAAEWVRYDNGRTRYWEIGNENYGDWEAGFEIDTKTNQDGQPRIISGALYGQHFRIFADSMKHAAAEIGHEIRIGAVATESDNPWNNVAMEWNQGVMEEAGDMIDYYVIHTYFTPYNEDSPPSTILESQDKVAEMKQYVLDDMENAGVEIKPIAMTEWNIFAVGSMQQVSNTNGLHAILSVGEFIENGFGHVMRWDIVNGWDGGNDHGMFSYGNEPGVPTWNPRPSFFYMYYMQRMFGDTMIKSEVSGDNDIISYASTFDSGEIGLVLVNRSSSDKIAKVSISGYSPAEYMMFSLEGGSDNYPFSRKVSVNGVSTTNQGGGPDDYVSIQPEGNQVSGRSVQVNVPFYGAVFMVMSKGELITGIDDIGIQNLKVFPNPSRGDFSISSEEIDLKGIEIFDLQGKMLYNTTILGNRFQSKSKLDQGIYVLKIFTEFETRKTKLIVQ